MSSSTIPGYERLLRILASAAIVLGPLGYLVGGLFAPAIHGAARSTILANQAAPTATNTVHLVAFFVASFLLPIGAAGLAYLAYPRAPWLATIGGVLGVLGWLPFSALTALDDLATVIAQRPGGVSSAGLLDSFTNDAVMNGFLIIYVVLHLVAYILLGLALRRARVVPAWAAWLLVASSPVTIAAFAFHDTARTVVGVIALGLLFVGSVPAGLAMLNPAQNHPAEEPQSPGG